MPGNHSQPESGQSSAAQSVEAPYQGLGQGTRGFTACRVPDQSDRPAMCFPTDLDGALCRAGAGGCPVASPVQLMFNPLRLLNYLAMGLIRLYQLGISPLLPKTCRFTPSCSRYGYEAFRKFNFFKAFMLTAWRVLRCNPFCHGGYDPLP